MEDSTVEETTTMETIQEDKTPIVKEVKQKFLFLGQTEEVDRITKYMKSQKDCTLIVLSKDEMDLIVGSRVGRQREEEVESFLDDDRHKQRAESLAMEFMGRFGEGFDKGFVRLSSLKKATSLSWTKFNEVISTLDMFGFVSWNEGKRESLKIIVDKQKIIDNRKVEIQRTLDFALGQLISLQISSKGSIDSKKIEALKKSLKVTF
jgi:hypothetical protein